ncbi:hypothetical protein S7711_01284 [Stachybotrys chartarum IBT 7711]|uniref:Ketoreductase (KR) domain-containing protein n=1 Tax=Stachybotrys chartarum (strain CBS 109288 / IBT 7711) TaxID=1280523 RepID=A0A084BBK5_STACB|nr:hypothetical protein S7711_01284 [Stachybotrys chartarum IBT 7711]
MRATAATLDEHERYHISFVNSVAFLEVTAEDLQPRDASENPQTLTQRCNSEADFEFQKQYFFVKLVAWFAMQGVAEKSEVEVVVNAACPGLCNTNKLHELPLSARLAMAVNYFIMGRSAGQGACTMIRATNLGRESHSKLWTNDQHPPPTALLANQQGEQLYLETWKESIGILENMLALP